ncbi:MAG: HEAT repeat domain-containing protein [Elusimicrobiales bacterium]|jgi:HEAT repeat protein
MNIKNTAVALIFILAVSASSGYSQTPAKTNPRPAQKTPGAAVKKTVKPAATKPGATKPAAGAAAAQPAAVVAPFDAAVQNLNSREPGVRRQGADFLGRSRDPKALPYLLKALGDASAPVRISACDGLGLLRAREASPRLSELVLKDTDPTVRQAAVIAMSYIGDRAAGPALMKALKDKEAGVRYAAMRTLSVLAYTEAEDAFIELLGDADVNMRRGAIAALGQLQSKKSVPGLTKALEDPDRYTRLEAIKALGDVGDAGVIGGLKGSLKDKDAAVRIGTALSLAKLGDASGLDTAYELIKAPDTGIRQQAGNVIAAIGDEKSLKFIEDLYAVEQEQMSKNILDFARQRLLSRLKIQKK